MPRIPNPAGGLMKRVDNTLESVDGVLGRTKRPDHPRIAGCTGRFLRVSVIRS